MLTHTKYPLIFFIKVTFISRRQLMLYQWRIEYADGEVVHTLQPSSAHVVMYVSKLPKEVKSIVRSDYVEKVFPE